MTETEPVTDVDVDLSLDVPCHAYVQPDEPCPHPATHRVSFTCGCIPVYCVRHTQMTVHAALNPHVRMWCDAHHAFVMVLKVEAL